MSHPTFELSCGLVGVVTIFWFENLVCLMDGSIIIIYERKTSNRNICLKRLIFSVFILDEPSAFYAEEIYDSTEGLGTNDEKLQRIFIQRSEVGGLCQYNTVILYDENALTS